ncbi:hypothetical protein HFO56_14675 [Rhizobium laguerreae]|uniref:hypothetical protein n=1 Tax=Rhizobium laguerreae TaxID=1076926 RepID=UPI001C915BE7|nr:hypothetical protein [Rhizobium laguerreae]MBY3153590.1 hypothetical protein [Rhizobium laguerreae]
MSGVTFTDVSRRWLEEQADRVVTGKKRQSSFEAETSLFPQNFRWAQEKGDRREASKGGAHSGAGEAGDVPTPEEMSLILDALGEERALLVRFLGETGVRKNGAYTHEWADVDVANQLVSIRWKDGFTPKTRHFDSAIPISTSFAEALSAAKKVRRMEALKAGDACRFGLSGPVWRKACKHPSRSNNCR